MCVSLSRPPETYILSPALSHTMGAEIERRQDEARGPAIVAAPRPGEHQGAVGGEDQLGEAAGKAAARLDQREQAARGHIDPLQDALPEQPDLAHEPVIRMFCEQ